MIKVVESSFKIHFISLGEASYEALQNVFVILEVSISFDKVF